MVPEIVISTLRDSVDVTLPAHLEEVALTDPVSRQATAVAQRLMGEVQPRYGVARTLRFAVLDTTPSWAARAIWPPRGPDEDWVILSGGFVRRCIVQAQAVARSLLRLDRARIDPAAEAMAAVARSDRCIDTVLTFFVAHELGHHVMGHSAVLSQPETPQETVRALEFAADIHGFQAAALRSLSVDLDGGGLIDPEQRLRAIHESAAVVAAVLPLVGTVRRRPARVAIEGGHHPFMGYRALLAHQLWANEVKQVAPWMDYPELDELFLACLKTSCVAYLEACDETAHLEELMALWARRPKHDSRLVQPVGYLSALGSPAALAHARLMRRAHDAVRPALLRAARAPEFRANPFDLIM